MPNTRKHNVYDYIGKKINHWTILEDAGTGKRYETLVKARCDCGYEKIQRLGTIITGRSKCCINCNPGSLKHGLKNSQLYMTWSRMKRRCNNPNCDKYSYYGGRGIRVCEEWTNDFMSFYNWAITNGYREDLTIDRIDVNGNYEPSNCRWTDRSIQTINQRKSIRNKSGYVGLSKRNDNKSIVWRVWIDIHHKHIYLGHYSTQKEALAVRNKYIEDHNLPHKIQEYVGEIGIKTEV